MSPARRLQFAVALLMSCAQHVFAWSEGGHLLIASIAYKQLTPSARTNVANILKHHVSFVSWNSKVPVALLATVPRDEYIFTRAGLWADEIRSSRHPDHAEDKPAWHYINYPLRPASYDFIEPINGDLHHGITNSIGRLRNPEELPARKAIALAWLIHLIADLHQPLHNTTLLLPRLPAIGDRGGNAFFIKPGQKPIKLHRFWDDLLGTSDNIRTHRNEAIRLTTSFPPSAFPQLALATTPIAWSLEARELAISVAYRGLDLELGTEDVPSTFPQDYKQTCKAVAERQATVAGYRLADIIVQTFAQQP